MKHICSSFPTAPPHWPLETEILQRITARFMERDKEARKDCDCILGAKCPYWRGAQRLCILHCTVWGLNSLTQFVPVAVSINLSISGISLKTSYSWRSILRRWLRILLHCELLKSSRLWHITGLINFNNKNVSITVYFMDYSAINIQ